MRITLGDMDSTSFDVFGVWVQDLFGQLVSIAPSCEAVTGCGSMRGDALGPGSSQGWVTYLAVTCHVCSVEEGLV